MQVTGSVKQLSSMSVSFATVCILSTSYLAYVVVGVAAECNLLIHVGNRMTGICVDNHSGEQQQLSCPNISSAFNYMSANATSSMNCVHVILSPGYHMFTQPHNLSVGLILTGNGSTVKCDYESTVIPVINVSDLQYTLFFLKVSVVKFETVQYEMCKQPFRLEEVENVTIIDSNFTQFTDAVFDIYNCIHINIDNSIFISNTGYGTVLLPLRGNTGAVSIGYHDKSFKNGKVPTVLITDCHFIANSASVKANTFSTSTTAFLRNTFTGRGGGLAVLMNLTIGDLNVDIKRCVFRQNHAVSFGGAIYLLFTGKELHHMVNIEDSLFEDNVADNGAGAIQVTFNHAEVLSGQPMTAFIHNCSFTDNKAVIGGAVFLFPSLEGAEGNLQILENCSFYRNQASETGAAVTASQFAFFVPKENLVNHRITNW